MAGRVGSLSPSYTPFPSLFFTRRSPFPLLPLHPFNCEQYLVTEAYSYLKEQAIVLRNMVATAYDSKKSAERAKQAATAAQVPNQYLSSKF